MAIDVDSILNKKSVVDRAFKNGKSKPWRLFAKEQDPQDSQNDTANKQLTNSKQTANNQLTNSKQIANKQLTSVPDKSVVENGYSKQTANNQLTTSKQTANKSSVVAVQSSEQFLQILFRLSNQQRKLFLYIHERCLENGDLASGPISSHIFSSLIAASNNTCRTQLQRLIEKGLLNRLPGKPGRGGFHAYSMSHLVVKAGNELRRHILKELSSHQKETVDDIANKQLTNSKQTANTIANKDPLSSSSNLIKTTTTNESEILEISSLEIDISPLEEIGFNYSHLSQITKRTDLEPGVIQDSINHFAFDLRHNNKAETLKGSPLNFFMGILVKGIPYNPPDNFEDEKTKALKAYLAKQKEQQEILITLEEEAREQAFAVWYAKLDEEKKANLLPPILRGRNTSDASKKLSLNGYFNEHEWPQIKEEIMFIK